MVRKQKTFTNIQKFHLKTQNTFLYIYTKQFYKFCYSCYISSSSQAPFTHLHATQQQRLQNHNQLQEKFVNGKIHFELQRSLIVSFLEN